MTLDREQIEAFRVRLGSSDDPQFRTYGPDLCNMALAYRQGKQKAGKWSLIGPDGTVRATESSCVMAWARMSGYKATVEGLLGYEQHGWRVVPAHPPVQPGLEEALRTIVAFPHGCRFCDSGTLRNPAKDHDDICGYAMAAKALSPSAVKQEDSNA